MKRILSLVLALSLLLTLFTGMVFAEEPRHVENLRIGMLKANDTFSVFSQWRVWSDEL